MSSGPPASPAPWSYTKAAPPTAPTLPTHAQLGRAVRRIRNARRLSIEALAGAAYMHPTYLSAIERGLRNPTWTKLCNLAGALNIQPSALVRAAEAEAYGAMYTPLP